MDSEYDWRPTAPLSHLQLRARLLRHIRDYFAEQQVLEVETPVLAQCGTSDPQIDSLFTHVRGSNNGRPVYLQTSPEHAMKRLLAAGSGPIYQISRVFRDAESGKLHSPEFTLLEWYRPGFDHHALMNEVEELLARLLGIDQPAQRLSYTDLFRRYLDIDPLQVDVEVLRACAARQNLGVTGLGDERDAWLDLLLSHVIQPQLAQSPEQGRMLFVYDYPPSQAALARINSAGLAERFELYLDGIELANGYHELRDSDEQRHRFEQDNRLRQAMNKPEMPVDEGLLAALEEGLPDCAGVALGIDRLILCATGEKTLAQVQAFTLIDC